MLGILKTLTYGQKLQIAEGSMAVRKDEKELEDWVEKSEARNEKAAKPKIKPVGKPDEKQETTAEGSDSNKNKKQEKKAMTSTSTNGETNCLPREHGYFCFTPQPIPQCATFFEFTSCCCEDGTQGLLEALYQFALAKKAANPSLLRVSKKFSPNSACAALEVDFTLFGNSTATLADYDSIASYYLQLLGY